MSKPDDALPRRARRPALRLAALAALSGLTLAAGAATLLSAVAAKTGADDRAPDKVRPGSPAAAAPATYQLRCWQYGRLLFDEGPVTLPPEARQAATLVAIDRHGAPLIVTDRGGATCLARPFAAQAPNLALPR